MGGGAGKGFDFGNSRGSGKILGLDSGPESSKQDDWSIGRSVGAAALNYDIRDPRTGRTYRFAEGTTISNVEVFAGKGVRNKLKPRVTTGLTEHYGGKPRNWKHVKGIGTIDTGRRIRTAEVHWFEEQSVGKVEFKVKRWMD